jgi:hypothetical protein
MWTVACARASIALWRGRGSTRKGWGLRPMGYSRRARSGLHELVVARPLRLNRLPPALQHRRSKIASHVRAVATWSRARSERGAPNCNTDASHCNTAPRSARPAPSSALPAASARCNREIGSDRELGSARAHRVVASSEIAASDSIMRAGTARAEACAVAPRPAGVGAGGQVGRRPYAHICTAAGLTPPTSAQGPGLTPPPSPPGLGSPPPACAAATS